MAHIQVISISALKSNRWFNNYNRSTFFFVFSIPQRVQQTTNDSDWFVRCLIMAFVARGDTHFQKSNREIVLLGTERDEKGLRRLYSVHRTSGRIIHEKREEKGGWEVFVRTGAERLHVHRYVLFHTCTKYTCIRALKRYGVWILIIFVSQRRGITPYQPLPSLSFLMTFRTLDL